MAVQYFNQNFHEAMDAIEADAKASGIDMTHLCEETGISRATPSRWKRRVPKTIELVTRLQKALEKAKQQRATGIPGE